MRASRSPWAVLVAICLVAAAAAPPACSHDIDETGLCATHCVLGDLAGFGSALPSALAASAPLDPAHRAAPVAGEPAPRDVLSARPVPRAPPPS